MAENPSTTNPDIVELGRRWQKAWTSHRPSANNAVGDSFGQLTDEIERLRTANADLLGTLKEAQATMSAAPVLPCDNMHPIWLKMAEAIRKAEQSNG